MALRPGNGDVNTGSFLLAKVRNRLITGVPHVENTGWRSRLLMAHSVTRVCNTRDRVAWMLQHPGRWTGSLALAWCLSGHQTWGAKSACGSLSTIWSRLVDVKHNHSVVAHQVQYLGSGRNLVTPRSTASIPNRLMCWLACWGDHIPCSIWESSCASHPWLEASVNRVISVSRALSETPCKTTREAHHATDGEWSRSLKSCLTRTHLWS